MCDGYLEEAESPLTDALVEIITLNREMRTLRVDGGRERRDREAELIARIEAQANTIEDQKHAILLLNKRLSDVPTTKPQRSVAAEMGLREKLMACHESLRDGMAKASGLVLEREPDQK